MSTTNLSRLGLLRIVPCKKSPYNLIAILGPFSVILQTSKTAFTRCRHNLKTVKNVTATKFELAFTRCRHNLKTVGKIDSKKSFLDFDAKEKYLHTKNRPVSIQKR